MLREINIQQEATSSEKLILSKEKPSSEEKTRYQRRNCEQ